MARQMNNWRVVHANDLPQEWQLNSPTNGRIVRNPSLPVYGKGSNYYSKKEILRSRQRHNLVHLIPVVVLLCLFILLWFSIPVKLEKENERNTVVGKKDMPEVVGNARLGSLTSTTSTPYPLVPYAKILKNSSRAERAVSTTG